MLLILSSALLTACVRSFEYNFDSKSKFSEAVAIETTRRCLKDYGLIEAEVKPVEYWPTTPNLEERYFARNRLDPRNGYVLWKSLNPDYAGSGNYDFSVSVEVVGNKIKCHVGKVH